MNVLQEKEEQLIQLKEEVSDLKTLVRVLEDENERLRRILSGGQPTPRMN
jgi:regulator of replication initiation timing